MLLEQRAGGGGKVSVLTRNERFNRLLQAILEEWHFITDAGAASLDILLLERGLPAPEGAHHIVWLTPMPLGTEAHLEVPLSLTALYHLLEKQFFVEPRHHIRLPVDLPVDLNVRGVWLVGRMLSISDRGARITCPALLPKREQIQLDFKLENYPLRVSADVLYEIPAGDGSGREHPQAGLVFHSLKPALGQALRRFIERSFVDLGCSKSGISPIDPCLSWLDLNRTNWTTLDL